MPTTMDHNFWVMLFEHTPPFLRWVLGVLTCGLYFLARYVWRNHVHRVHAVEARIDNLHGEMHTGFRETHARIDEANKENTRRMDSLFAHFGIKHD